MAEPLTKQIFVLRLRLAPEPGDCLGCGRSEAIVTRIRYWDDKEWRLGALCGACVERTTPIARKSVRCPKCAAVGSAESIGRGIDRCLQCGQRWDRWRARST